MSVAYVCVRCDDCEQIITTRKIERIGTKPYCRPCKRRIETATCPKCGHLELALHTVFGCMFEDADGVFCPCQPAMLSDHR